MIAYGSALRYVIMLSLFFLPATEKVRIERWLRGREDFRKLGLADAVIVSFGKSGRTWLRVMISRLYQVKYGLSERHLIGFDNLHRKNRAIPKLFFTHDNYLKDYTKNVTSKEEYYNKRVVLMIRDPADVAVSQYNQWKYRMRPGKKKINAYPSTGAEVGLFEFVIGKEAGLPKIIDWMNGWAKDLDRIKELLIVRYEEMRADPEGSLARIVDFIGTPGNSDQIREAVNFASVENMRKLEEKRVFWLSGGRMTAKDRSNPNSFKVRRAKVGGYLDDFTPEQVAQIEELVASRLAPVFGYGPQRGSERAVAG